MTIESSLRRVAAVAVILAGCAGPEIRRHDRALAELDRPPDPAAEPVQDLATAATLDHDAVVAEVLRANPSIAAAREGIREALARAPAALAWEDPRVSYAFAPASIGATGVAYGQVVEVEQALPIGGRRRLQSSAALFEADAARSEVTAVRIALGRAASELYWDYWRSERSLETSRRHRELLGDVRSLATALYQVGRASAQDPLAAEAELARIEQTELALETDRRVAIAGLNGLMHRDPAADLPSPPREAQVAGSDEDEATLQGEALERRPELAALDARGRAAEQTVSAARRSFYPDLAVMASYNSMWTDVEHRFMLGAALSVPLQIRARRAAVAEGRASAQRLRHQRDGAAQVVRTEVVQARRRLEEAARTAGLYESRLIPAARSQLEAARAGFQSGQSPFSAVLAGQRNLLDAELGLQVAIATSHKRRADLAAALGRVPTERDKEGP